MNGTIAALELKRKDNFLLLRVIAALLVIYGHSFAITQPNGSLDIFLTFNWGRYSGELAVSVFFIVSGFMVTGSYLRKNNIFNYLIARVLRITPALIVVILASVFLIGPITTSLTLKEYFSTADTYTYLTKNITYWSSITWDLPGVFKNHPYQAVNGSLWTIPAEFRMYIVIGLLGITGLLNRKLFCGALLISAFFVSIYDPSFFSKNIDAVRLGGYFCLGVIAQLFKEKIPVRHEIFILLVIPTFLLRDSFLYFYLLTLSTAYFCFWFAYCTPHVAIEKYGDPSYGIYLWGWPIQQLLVFLQPNITPYINSILAAFVTTLIGYLSWHLIESKISAYKTLRFKKHDQVSSSI
jgi:peptidoglycan/LPS O-acetylase OafA/YrhL